MDAAVLLVTLESLKDENWARDAVDHFAFVPSTKDREQIITEVSRLARHHHIDRIAPLDDYEVEHAALLREHLRVPGMGDTTARHWRDKLAMRMKAREAGILVPEFVHVLNDEDLRDFMERVGPPWVLKPRAEAASRGVEKIPDAESLWRML